MKRLLNVQTELLSTYLTLCIATKKVEPGTEESYARSPKRLTFPVWVPREWQSHAICRSHIFVNVGSSSVDVEYAVARRGGHVWMLQVGRIGGTQKSQRMAR